MTIHQQATVEFLAVMFTFLFIAFSAKAIWPRVRREMQWRQVKHDA